MTKGFAPCLYHFSATSIDGSLVPMSRFQDKVLVIVNTASACGFTPQFQGLEELYRRFRSRGLVVLGFPCNQFGGQEPGSGQSIAHFCETEYNVSFPIFRKVEVNGPDAHPLFSFLRHQKGGSLRIIGLNSIKWNFTKFLVGRDGRVVSRHAPSTNPAKLAPAIERLLTLQEAGIQNAEPEKRKSGETQKQGGPLA